MPYFLISLNSFPSISLHKRKLNEETFMNSKKDSCRGNYMRNYGIGKVQILSSFFDISSVNLKVQNDPNFCGLLRISELYHSIYCLSKLSFVLNNEKTSKLEILSQTAIGTVVEDSNNRHLT